MIFPEGEGGRKGIMGEQGRRRVEGLRVSPWQKRDQDRLTHLVSLSLQQSQAEEVKHLRECTFSVYFGKECLSVMQKPSRF